MTTVATRIVTARVSVFDDIDGDLVAGSTCTTRDVYSRIREGSNLILEDASSGEVLGVTQLEQGRIGFESVAGGVPDSAKDLFWYCTFSSTLTDIPLDREFYLLHLENDPLGITHSLEDVRDGTVGMSWFYSDEEDTRNSHRS